MFSAFFLAAQSSSRSLAVCWLVGLSVGPTLVQVCDRSDSIESRDSHDSSDSRKKKLFFSPKKYFSTSNQKNFGDKNVLPPTHIFYDKKKMIQFCEDNTLL